MNDTDGVHAPLDEIDGDILAGIQALYTAVDPVPDEAYSRVLFALDLEYLESELARLAAEETVGSLARGTEQVQTMTFESPSLTITVSITRAEAGTFRLDGWVVPVGSLRVELRTGDLRLQAMSDEGGRFVFDDVATGEVQLAVHPTPGSGVDLSRTVRTPPMVL